MKRVHWAVVGAAVSLLGWYLIFAPWDVDRHMRADRSIDRAKTVIAMCRAYRDDPQSGGRYPASLDELASPSFGGRPFVEKDYDLDGWGHRFRYAVVSNDQGEAEPHIWAERVVNGAVHHCGAKGTADGRVVVFGQPGWLE